MVKKRVIKSPIMKVDKKDVIPGQAASDDFRDYLNVYEFDIPPLPGSGEKLKIKPLTTGQIKNLLVHEGSEDDLKLMTTIFDDLISESVITEDFDLTNLYLQDRFFLLLEIRKKTKGELHEYEHICTNDECKSQSLKVFDLNKLVVTPKSDNIEYIIRINDNISVEMDFLKRKDEFEALEALKIIKENVSEQGIKLTELQEQAELALLYEASGIKNILLPNGPQKNLSIFDKKFFIENIPKIIHQKIKDWYQAEEFGVEFKVKIECEHCKTVTESELTYDNFFF